MNLIIVLSVIGYLTGCIVLWYMMAKYIKRDIKYTFGEDIDVFEIMGEMQPKVLILLSWLGVFLLTFEEDNEY